MKILQRLKNLWKISEFTDVNHDSEGKVTFTVKNKGTPNQDVMESHKMAQIIKRTNPTAEFLKKANE